MRSKFLLILIVVVSVNVEKVRPLIGVGYNVHFEFSNSSVATKINSFCRFITLLRHKSTLFSQTELYLDKK